MTPSFHGGINIAIKIPKSKYEKTVAFYRDQMNWPVEEQTINHPTVSRIHKVVFGHNIIWLDCVDNYTRSETWLEITTPHLAEAKEFLASRGTHTCDEIEALPQGMHWIADPAGNVFIMKGE